MRSVIMSEKQHIVVGVRIRPFLEEEVRADEECVGAENNRVTVTASHRLKHFDIPALDRHASQQQVFQSYVQPLLEDLIRGYSCAFLSCGQTRSGKSYTVSGGESEDSKGVIPRAVGYLGRRLGQEAGTTYILQVSYLQICEQEVVDLLGIQRRTSPQVVERGREVDIEGVDIKHVQQLQEIQNYFILGNRKRNLAYTKKYRRPEKCTAIFTIYLQSYRQEQGREVLKYGKLHIVDMAASKKVERFELNFPMKPKEKYDLSASALRNVANAIVFGKKQTKVPYNDSKVTMILREYLGGYGRTKILFHLYPGSKGYSATVDALRLAKTLSMVENQPYCHADPNHMTIIARLTELTKARTECQQMELRLKASQGEMLEEGLFQQNSSERKENRGEENEFLSQSMVASQRREEVHRKMERLIEGRIRLKRTIDNLSSLFLKVDGSMGEGVEFVRQEAVKVNKKRQYLSQSMGERWENVKSEESRYQDRISRQQIFQLQQQFQEEREAMLQRIRELQGQYQFYQRVSLQTVKPEEIDLLKNSSRYDATKRKYEVPAFAVRQKKLSLAQRFFSPNNVRESISSRKFVLGKSISSKGKVKSVALSASRLRAIKQITSPKKDKQQPQTKTNKIVSSKSQRLCVQRQKALITSQGLDDYGLSDTKKKSRTNKPSLKQTSEPRNQNIQQNLMKNEPKSLSSFNDISIIQK